EGGDRTGHLATDVGQRLQQDRRRAAYELERTQPLGQRLGRGLAQVRDAEREQEARQRGRLAGRDAGNQILGPARGELARGVDRQVRAQERRVPPLLRLVGERGQTIGIEAQRAAAV